MDVKAQAGINAGDDQFEMIEIGTDVSKTTNVGIPGVWMYQTNEGTANKPSEIVIVVCTYVYIHTYYHKCVCTYICIRYDQVTLFLRSMYVYTILKP